jgi:hypothetical protein
MSANNTTDKEEFIECLTDIQGGRVEPVRDLRIKAFVFMAIAAVVILFGASQLRGRKSSEQDQSASAIRTAEEFQVRVLSAQITDKYTWKSNAKPEMPERLKRDRAADAIVKELPSMKSVAEFVIFDKGKTPEFRTRLAEKIALLDKLQADLESSNRIYNSKLTRQLAEDKAARQKQGHDLGVSMDAYNRIRDGMSLFEVYEIVGEWGTEVSSAGDLKTYTWSDGFKSIVCTTDGGEIIAKAQFGL